MRLFELKKWQKSGLGGRAHLLHHLELVEGRKSNIPALVYFAITASKSAQSSFQSGNAFAVTDMDDRAALQIPYDREVSLFRLTMTYVDFVDADRLDFRCVNCCKSLPKISFLNVFYRVPSQMIMFCQCSDAELFPKLKNRPLELIAEAGFRMRNERDLLNGTFMATMAVH